MIKVKDSTGKVIEGIFRTPNGSLIIDDSTAKTRYELERRRATEITELKTQVAQLTELVNRLLNDKK